MFFGVFSNYIAFIKFQTQHDLDCCCHCKFWIIWFRKMQEWLDYPIQSSDFLGLDYVQFLYSNYVTSEFTACSLTICFLQHGVLKVNSWLSLGFIWGIWRRFLLPQERDLSIILSRFFLNMDNEKTAAWHHESQPKKHSCLTSTSDSLWKLIVLTTRQKLKWRF